MQKIKLNERQVLMLQKLQENNSKSKVMKINEDQYNRLFNGKFNANKQVSKNFEKTGLDEESKKNDLLFFAQEVIVFIKDMLSRPDTAQISDFWLKQGVSKDKLISMLEKEGLLMMTLDEGDGNKTYVTEKFGFRKKIKEFYKSINELDNYPAGADNDSSAPWNQSTKVSKIKTLNNKPLNVVWFSNEAAILKDSKNRNFIFYYLSMDKSNFEDYVEREETERYQADGDHYVEYSDEWEIDERAIELFVNDNIKFITKGKGLNGFESGKELVLMDDELTNHVVEYFDDAELTNILMSVGETTGAASSGSYVGGISGGPINKNTGKSPEDELKNIISDGVDPSGVVEFHSNKKGEEPFIVDGIKWQFVNALYDGKLGVGVYRIGQDLTYSYEWFNNNVLKTQKVQQTNDISEMDSAIAGGDSGTFAYDAPAGDGSAFWNAGNEENEGNAKNPKTMPMVRGGKISESKIFTEGLKVGQVYKNGVGRRKVNGVNKFTGEVKVRQWGDGNARNLTINKKDFGGWELMSEQVKVMKITEAQLKKILEISNQDSTAYPNGEMVDFDDCVKLNNNKVAQNGGCSQGDTGVVKLSKTKDSVVAEVARITGKPIKEVKLIIEANSGNQLIPLFLSAIDQVDESLGYEELANAIGYIFNEHYGSHLVEPFLNKLSQILVRRNEGDV